MVSMNTEKNTSKTDENGGLPYSTTHENLIKLIDAIKKKEGNEDAIKKIYSGNKFDSTRRSLEIIGILKNGVDLSAEGRQIAYETDEKLRQKLYLKKILEYPAYEHLILNIAQQGFSEDTDLETVKSYWGKHSYGSSPNNRDEAAVVFGYFLQLAGIGEIVLGRRGKSSRIKWSDAAKTLLEDANKEVKSTPQSETLEKQNVLDSTNKEEPSAVQTGIQVPIEAVRKLVASENIIVQPNITISVDMSNWEIDKIQAFFKVAYGFFGENDEPKD